MKPGLEGEIFTNSLCFAASLIALTVLTLGNQSDGNHLTLRSPVKALLAGIAVAGGFFALSTLLGISNAFLALGISLGLVIGLLRPASALSFFLLCICIRPWELLSGATLLSDLTELSLGIVLAALLIHRLRNRMFPFYLSSAHLPFVLFLVWILLGILLLGHMEEGLPYFSKYFTPIVALVLLIPQCVRTRADLRIFTASLVFGCLSIIAQALHVTLTAPVLGIDGVTRLQSSALLLGNANDLASLIVLAAPIAFVGWIVKSSSLAEKVFGILVCGVFIWALWLAQSRGAILALALSTALYFFSLGSKGLFRNLFVLLILAISLFFVTSLKRNFEDLSGSREARLNYLVTGLNMIKSNPLFGVGIGNYPKRYEQFTESFYEHGERTAHSSWTLAAAETGLPGLLFFVLMFLTAFRAAFAIRNDHPEYLLALAAYTVAISFLSHTYFFFPYLICVLPVSAFSVFRGGRRPASKLVTAS